MLCLQRKLNQKVELTLHGKTLGTIMVTKIQGEYGRSPSVWLGFDMPPEVMIVRDDAGNREPKARAK